MTIVEVSTEAHKRAFLELPVTLYKNEKNWIRPLDKDVESVFDPKTNKYFRHGRCVRWLLQDAHGKVIGRVAAFVDDRSAKKGDVKAGGMGFFECINDQQAANLLFDTCKDWLEKEGVEAMDGPINFGDRDKWWGLLVEGFTEPNYCMPYNFLYYKELFENYGFQLYFKQFTYHRKVHEGGLQELVVNKAKRITDNPDYTFETIKKNKLPKYAEDFRTVYNKAWVKHQGVSEMPKAQALALINKLKPVLDERLVMFAYYQGEPVAFFIMIPELNQVFKYVNGKLDLIGKIKFLWHKFRKTNKKMLGLVFGVVPEHQGKGVESAIVVSYSKIAWTDSFHYTDLEFNWIGDFNPKMMRVSEQVGGKIIKTHHTYRLLFDKNREFKRMPIID